MNTKDYTLVDSYELSDGRMYMLNWNDIVLGPVIRFINGVWRGRFAWQTQSPDFNTSDEVADWMRVQYMTRQEPDTSS